MKNLVDYILQFLIGDHYTKEIGMQIAYTSDESQFSQYKLVIRDSGFFDDDFYGSKKSLPTIPLQIWENTPILYGEPLISKQGKTCIIHADLVASAFFLLSNYECFISKERDAHGRFPGKSSLPYQANFIDRPIVDEYGVLLRQYLREVGIDIPEPPQVIRKIYLTHDVDIPYFYRREKGFIKGLLKSGKPLQVLQSYFGKLENDPAYTFPYFLKINQNFASKNKNTEVESIFFLMAGGGTPQDKPIYNLFSKDIQSLISLCKENNATIGLHTSYYSGMHPEQIETEKRKLEKATNTNITFNRHHFLAWRNLSDFHHLIQSGITDDFTMGYADVAGFRIGTCRPVHWINPADKKVYPLILHPLTIMECTLDRPNYMNLSFEEAQNYCFKLIHEVKKHNGELILLWHNTSFIESPNNWQGKLYQNLLT